MVKYPFPGKNDRNNKNKTPQQVKIIDVSGDKRFRPQSWTQYYDQIHGFIYVVDASEKIRWKENRETLEDLLEHEKLRDKPVLM